MSGVVVWAKRVGLTACLVLSPGLAAAALSDRAFDPVLPALVSFDVPDRATLIPWEADRRADFDLTGLILSPIAPNAAALCNILETLPSQAMLTEILGSGVCTAPGHIPSKLQIPGKP